MADAQGIDVEQIIEHTRERIRKRQQDMMPSGLSIPTVDSQVSSDLTSLHDNYDVYNFHFTSHRWVLGKFVVLAKKILRKLLTPMLTRQVAYNASNTRAVTHVMEQLGHLARQQPRLIEDIRAEQAQSRTALEEQLTQVRTELLTSQAQSQVALEERLIQVLASQTQVLQEQHRVLDRIQSEVLQGMQGRLSMAERKLRRLIHMFTAPQEEGKPARV